MLTGPNGLLNQAKEAKELTEEAEVKEREDLDNMINNFLENENGETGNTGVTLDQVKQVVTQLIEESKLEPYPVGSIYISTNETSPETLFGGTWKKYAEGRTIIGEGESDKKFSIGETGGNSTHTLTVDEMPAHTHAFAKGGSALVIASNSSDDDLPTSSGYLYGAGGWYQGFVKSRSYIGSTGGNKSYSTLTPYIVTYMWERIK